MRYGYGFACLIAAIYCLFAYAATCQAMPSSSDPQISAWISQMSGWVPLNSLDVEIEIGPCPGIPQAGGCYDGDTIWISSDSVMKEMIGHEIGHVFDERILNPGSRNKIKNRYFKVPNQPWMTDQGADALLNCPMQVRCSNEMFADGFSACARDAEPLWIQESIMWDRVGGYGLEWTPFLYKHLCSFIDKVGSKAEAW